MSRSFRVLSNNGFSPLYQIALPATHLRRRGQFVTPVQVFDLQLTFTMRPSRQNAG